MRSTLPIAIVSLLAACEENNHHHHDTPAVPVFIETESNDDPLTANDFGVLVPGDHFFIDGFVRDDALDLFDGFAFRANEPLHVDFQLFIGTAGADLDVCLYDPQIDQTVACFATDSDPEQGGVDVFAGGLAFHLVVESFVGDASYSLEIVAQPLLVAAAQEPHESAAATHLNAVGARADHESAAEFRYHKRESARRPSLEIERNIEIDRERGLVLEFVRVRGAAD